MVQVLRESTNNTVDVEVFQPPTTGYGFDVALVNVEIDLVSKKASKVGNAGELDAPELSAHLLRHFGGQVCFASCGAFAQAEVTYCAMCISSAGLGPGAIYDVRVPGHQLPAQHHQHHVH